MLSWFLLFILQLFSAPSLLRNKEVSRTPSSSLTAHRVSVDRTPGVRSIVAASLPHRCRVANARSSVRVVPPPANIVDEHLGPVTYRLLRLHYPADACTRANKFEYPIASRAVEMFVPRAVLRSCTRCRMRSRCRSRQVIIVPPDCIVPSLSIVVVDGRRKRKPKYRRG